MFRERSAYPTNQGCLNIPAERRLEREKTRRIVKIGIFSQVESQLHSIKILQSVRTVAKTQQTGMVDLIRRRRDYVQNVKWISPRGAAVIGSVADDVEQRLQAIRRVVSHLGPICRVLEDNAANPG
jgi:hypothetical protein